MNKNTRSLSAFSSLYMSFSDDISARQGGHHVAQKLTNTTFPRRSAVDTVFPLSLRKAKESGSAGTPANGASFLISALNSPTLTNCLNSHALASVLTNKTISNPQKRKLPAFCRFFLFTSFVIRL